MKQVVTQVGSPSISIFILLFIFNIEVAFSNSGNGDIEIFGVKISLVKTILGKETLPPEGDGGEGGSGSNQWADTRTDIWHCYNFQTICVEGISFPCYTESLVSVISEVCRPGGSGCYTVGTCRWNPNPPCGSGPTRPHGVPC